MHKKSFTLGLGTGILFVTAIFYFMVSFVQPEVLIMGIEMTDEEIFQRVEELGYIILSSDLEYYQEEQAGYNEILDDEYGYEISYDDEYYEIPINIEYYDVPSNYELYYDEPLEPIVVEIVHLMPAVNISQLLYENNVIQDPNSFTNFLISVGYTTRLRAGVSTFYPNMTYEEILHILTTDQEEETNI